MIQKNMLTVSVLCSAILLAGCFKSARKTDGYVNNDATDTADGYDLPPDSPPDIPPDRPPDPDDMPPDVSQDYPLDYSPDFWTDVSESENFCNSILDGICAYFLACCTENEQRNLKALDMYCTDQWNDMMLHVCYMGFSNPINTGLITIDFGGYAALLSELDAIASSCPNYGSFPFLKEFIYRQWVGAALNGSVDEGEPCQIDEECLDGLYCDVYTGLCTATVRLGGVCGDDAECGLGRVCNLGRCAEPQSAGGPCDDYEDCDVGLWCDGDACREGLPLGAPCELETMNCQGFCTLEPPPGTCRDFCNGY